jgi:hypothetical protein
MHIGRTYLFTFKGSEALNKKDRKKKVLQTMKKKKNGIPSGKNIK